MLGKLIKNEWKSTWKLPAGLCLFVLIMTGLGCLSFRMPMWRNIAYDRMSSFSFFDVLAVTILITYFVSIVISSFAITIYFAIRFFKNLFSDEGYLMHTLPVTPWQLIVSKSAVNLFWQFLSLALLLGSMVFLIYFWMRSMITGEDWRILTEFLSTYMPEMQDVFRKYAGISLTGFFLFMIPYGVACTFSGVATIYACISVGQLFHKHKVAASIIAYLVMTSLIQVVTTIAILPFSFRLMFSMKDIAFMAPMDALLAPLASLMPIFYVSLALALVCAVVCYAVTHYLMKRKLNLD